MFVDNRIYKYLAIVRGFPPGPESSIALCESSEMAIANRKARMLSLRRRGSAPSSTENSSIPLGAANHSLFSCLPLASYRSSASAKETSSRNRHPIIGDTTHGDSRQNTSFRERNGFLRLFLHASDLGFTHPFTDEPLSVQAPIPSDFQDAIKACGLE